MAVYPGAVYRPLNQFSYQGRMSSDPLGLVLHVNDGSDSASAGSLYEWIAGDNGMSCHWQISDVGHVEQYVDTANASWCQTAGNRTYFSVETQGKPGEPLTPAQVTALSGLVAWLFPKYDIPFQLADVVGSRGFAWHGMGGDAWGGHPDCPGVRKGQRSQILANAYALVHPAPKPVPVVDPVEEIVSYYGSQAAFEAAIRAIVREQLVEFNYLPGQDYDARPTNTVYTVVGAALKANIPAIAGAVKSAVSPAKSVDAA